jgi:hypothetical protein
VSTLICAVIDDRKPETEEEDDELKYACTSDFFSALIRVSFLLGTAHLSVLALASLSLTMSGYALNLGNLGILNIRQLGCEQQRRAMKTRVTYIWNRKSELL